MDFTNLVGPLIESVAATWYIENYLRLKQIDPFKSKVVKFIPVVAVLIAAIGEYFQFSLLSEYMMLIVIIFLALFLWKLHHQTNIKSLLWVVLPFCVLNIFSLLFPTFIYADIVKSLSVFSAFWLIGFGWYVYAQNKKEQLKKIQQEAERKALEEQNQKLEIIVSQRTAEISSQKSALEKSMEELKATQAQLIQSEKMASLGELTAGIAHEIQNPLNFVNNFSEICNEMLDEMKTEIENNNLDEVKSIAENIKQNLEKINHHGKRADSIVKGMLQHSRKTNGQKEATDLNALCDEYLRLSYHGLRAKDKSFNAKMITDYDAAVGMINVVAQDMGRVILNIITNAFYACTERLERARSSGETGFEPTVWLTTKRDNDKVTITIRDNGNGIPKNVIDKIFQPFFTTKPTGQGTGLGLSMAYDIVTKGHNGELKLETKEGEGTTFKIILNA